MDEKKWVSSSYKEREKVVPVSEARVARLRRSMGIPKTYNEKTKEDLV
jgi:hypothetical protein